MTELLRDGALLFLSEECFDNYVLEHDFLDVPCFKALLSKALGIAIIGGSLLVKVPQVLKIFNNKSGQGINLVGVFLDLMAITFHMSYSYVNRFPFSAWGDSTFLAIQTALIAALVLWYSGQQTKAFGFTILYGIIVYVLTSGLTSLQILTTIQSLNIPILLIGKLSQALTNYRNGSTGQLSAATVIMLFAGSLARIFTSIQETGDSMMIVTFCASSFANFVIFAQLLYYWNRSKPGTKFSDKSSRSAKKPKAKKVD